MDKDSYEIYPEDVDFSENTEPVDKCRLVYMIFFFIGIGTLLPWNFFITANQYFMYQLRNRSLPEDVDPLLPINQTPIQTFFTNNLALCSMAAQVLTNFINLVLKEFVSAFTRLVVSAVVILLMFILTVVLTKVEIETYIFFVVTLTSVVFINIGSSVNQGSTYGILSALPESNSRGFLEGQAMAGIIAAFANLIIIAASSDPGSVGFVYFLIAVFIIANTIFLFFILFKNAYFRYNWNKQDESVSMEAMPFGKRIKQIASRLWQAMWEIRWAGIVAFLTFATTLSVYPSFFVLVVPQKLISGNIWETKYFHAVTVFVSYNISDYLGRMLVGCVKWPKFELRKTFVALAIFRIAIVPLVMFCNVQPRRLPVAFHHDAFPIIFVILLGLTNGYFVCLAVNYAQRYATKGNEESCGIATATYVTMGLFFGVAISYGLVMAL